MKLLLLIESFKDGLQKQREQAKQPSAQDATQRDTYYFHLETQLTFTEFQTVINQLIAFGADTEMTADHLKIVTDFFEKRWDRIKNTDAIYNIAIQNPANQLCLEAADFVFKHKTNEFVQDEKWKNHLALLMPTVKSWRDYRSKDDLSRLLLHNFILSDDNQHCIRVAYLVDKIDNRGNLLLSQEVGESERKVIGPERARVLGHSAPVRAYYNNMKRLLKDPEANKKTIEREKNTIRTQLKDDNYAKHSIDATYGEAGYALLESNLLKSVNELFITREQLFDYMSSTRVKQKDWKSFVSSINDEALVKLINNGTSLKYTVQSEAMYNGHQNHDRAVLFCLAEAYWRERAKHGEYIGWTGRVFGYAKSVKQGAIDVIQGFLIGGQKLGEWEKFVEDNHKALSGAIKDGTVGYISAHIKAIEDKQKVASQDVVDNKPLAMAMK